VNPLRVGTRGSQLALWQARTVASMLEQTSGASCEIIVIKTTGDRLAEAPLSEAGGKRLFVKEIEDALLRNDVDLAVHSCKDMPVALPDGLQIAAVLPREDPHDIVVLPASAPAGAALTPDELRSRLGSARIGTSSVRRIAELHRFLPDARFEPIRGNLDTRLRKLDRGDYDALVLAAAGVRRLGFADRISAMLPFDLCIPAPGQGAIAVEVRTADTETRGRVAAIDHAQTAAEITAERAVVSTLGGGCQTPIGAIAELRGDTIHLRAVVASLDGSRAARGQTAGAADRAGDLGAALAAQMIRDGALAILEQVRRDQGTEN
jgi:hydroxymethylbilane synthase